MTTSAHDVLQGRESWTVLEGHVIEQLKLLSDDCIHCVVTSPPYFGQRSYGTSPQIWDDDPICQHHWQSRSRPGMTGGHGKKSPIQSKSTRMAAMFDQITDSICDRCGAWRWELGLEPTPQLFVQHLVLVFREVRRILHPSGVCWINLGDSYAGSAKGIGSNGEAYAGPKQATNKG